MTIVMLQPKSKNPQQRQLLRVNKYQPHKKEFTMEIVADNTKFNQAKHFDNLNKFDRYMDQTKSAVAALLNNDSFENLSKDCLSNMLWLIEERLNDIELVHQRIVEGV